MLVRASALVSTLEDLVAGLTSDFLFVTGTFDGLAAGFAATLVTVLATVVFATGAAFLLAALPAGVAVFVLDATVAVLPAGLATTAFFSTGLLDFAATALVLLAAAVGVFAGFFIAFAIGSLPRLCP